jgi:hypothetical protein
VRAGLVLWCGVFVVGSMLVDTAPLSWALVFHVLRDKMQGPLFNSPRLSGIHDREAWYVALVNDGIGLLQKYRRPGDTIASLDFSNPFSYALEISPPPGGTPIGLMYRTNFDEENKVPPEFLFGRASLVMVPTVFTDWSLQDAIPRIYGPYLREHFHQVGQTSSWHLYRRNE